MEPGLRVERVSREAQWLRGARTHGPRVEVETNLRPRSQTSCAKDDAPMRSCKYMRSGRRGVIFSRSNTKRDAGMDWKKREHVHNHKEVPTLCTSLVV